MSGTADRSSIRAREFVRKELRELPAYHLDQTPYEFKLDQNEVPWDLPTRLKDEALRRLRERNWAFYPDFHGERLRELLGDRYGVTPSSVLVGNGSNELLGIALEAMVGAGQEVISLLPGFGLYEMFVRRSGGRTRMLPPRADLSLQMDELLSEVRRDPTRPVLLCSPNNPTGAAAEPAAVDQLLRELRAPLLLDNAYGEFCRYDYVELLGEHPHLVLFRTFSKAWSLAGLRLGYVMAAADLIDELIKVKLPYNINHASAVVGELVLERSAWAERCVRVLRGRRAQWTALFEQAGCEVFPSEANFLLVRHPRIDEIRSGLAERRILIRKVDHYPGLADCVRVAIGDGRAQRATARALHEVLGEVRDGTSISTNPEAETQP